MRIIGMRKEFYIGSVIEGHNCDFETKEKTLERHIILAELSTGEKIQIELSEEYGECYSGWTTASWGNCVVSIADNMSFTHRPKKPLYVTDIEIGEVLKWNCDVFSVSFDGGDEYYPGGFYSVNEDLFEVSNRAKESRVVWIFKGDSNSGKSYIASKLNSLKVLETDSFEYGLLPLSITEDVIVVGNKYEINIDELKGRLFGETEVVVVNFGTE